MLDSVTRPPAAEDVQVGRLGVKLEEGGDEHVFGIVKVCNPDWWGNDKWMARIARRAGMLALPMTLFIPVFAPKALFARQQMVRRRTCCYNRYGEQQKLHYNEHAKMAIAIANLQGLWWQGKDETIDAT